jgi:hypothetical protein
MLRSSSGASGGAFRPRLQPSFLNLDAVEEFQVSSNSFGAYVLNDIGGTMSPSRLCRVMSHRAQPTAESPDPIEEAVSAMPT